MDAKKVNILHDNYHRKYLQDCKNDNCNHSNYTNLSSNHYNIATIDEKNHHPSDNTINNILIISIIIHIFLMMTMILFH